MLALGQGVSIPKWFEIVGTTDDRGTNMTVQIMADGRPMTVASKSMPVNNMSLADILGMFPNVTLPTWIAGALSLVKVPPSVRVMGRPVANDDPKNEHGILTVEVNINGKVQEWKRELNFNRVQLGELTSLISWLKAAQSGRI